MKQTKPEQAVGCEASTGAAQCSGRREFLVRAITTTGGLALGLTVLTAHADDAPAKADELIVKLGEHNALKEIGGFETFDTAAGKITVAHIAEDTFAACSAVCPHKGGPINYDKNTKQFFCPLHGSRFTTDGKVFRGPARRPLKSYASQTAAVVSLTAT